MNSVVPQLTEADWHLEFTTNDHAPQNSAEPEDELVLYFPTRAERDALADR